MSLQVFLEARLTGTKRFLAECSGPFETRIRWASLVSDVLPRALLAELGLSPMLLGFSGGGRFLLLLPQASIAAAHDFLRRAASHTSEVTGGSVRLIWATTEDLGTWIDIRRRIESTLAAAVAAPLSGTSPAWEPFAEPDSHPALLTGDVRGADTVGWDRETPATVHAGSGSRIFRIGEADGDIFLARQSASEDDPAPSALARRASGRRTWGILVGDVDGFKTRLAAATSVEDYLHLCGSFRRFFALHTSRLAAETPFQGRIAVLGSGLDDFVVYGSWSALPAFAERMREAFRDFVNREFGTAAGPDGSTMSASVSLAAEPETPLSFVYRHAEEGLRAAKSAGQDSFHIFGRTLGWEQLREAYETRSLLVRMIRDYGCSRQLLYELAAFYRDAVAAGRATRRRNLRLDRPWRFHRRLRRITGAAAAESRDFDRVRNELIADFTGGNAARAHLRPWGRVALEWAKLETEV